MSWLERLGKGAPKGQDQFQHRRQTSILPLLLHVITQERKIAVPKWRSLKWNPLHFSSPCYAHWYGNTLKATVQLDGFLLLPQHLNGPALFPLLIIMKAFHYTGSYTANKQLWIQYCKCKLKCVFKARVRGEKVIKLQALTPLNTHTHTHTLSVDGVGNTAIFGH